MVTRSSPVAAARGVGLTRIGVALAAAIALLFAYYAWTATSSGNPFNKVTPFFFKYGDADYYNLQADAFLKGHLWLDVPVDPRLSSAPNPYAVDVTGFGLLDAPYYDGRWWLAWGPAPAVTTFLPARLLGFRLQENLVITLYAFFGVLLGGLALTRLVRRLVPGTSRRVIWAGNAALALATALPWILRRPTVYEVVIAGAFFFCMAGLFLMVRELTRDDGAPPRTSRLAWAGVLYGLAVLTRPNMGFVALATVGVAWALLGARPPRRVLLCLAGIPVLAGVLFMVYNLLRFSGPLDFGNKWQLSGRDARDLSFNDLANLPPALFGYLVAPLHPGLEFPYIHLPPLPNAPFSGKAGYYGEQTGSVLWAVPFTLLAVAVLLRRRGSGGSPVPRPVRRVVLALIVVALAGLLPGAFTVPGYTERYELDFLPYLVMAATLGWAELIRGAKSARRAMWWRRGGLALAAWSVIVGVAIGFTGYYDGFKYLDADRFRALERAFSPLPTLVTALSGHPALASVAVPDGVTGYDPGYTTLSWDGVGFKLSGGAEAALTIVSPSARDVALRFTARTAVADGAAVAVPSVTQTGAGEATSVAVSGDGPASLPLHLERGVNYVTLSSSGGDVVLTDVRVR